MTTTETEIRHRVRAVLRAVYPDGVPVDAIDRVAQVTTAAEALVRLALDGTPAPLVLHKTLGKAGRPLVGARQGVAPSGKKDTAIDRIPRALHGSQGLSVAELAEALEVREVTVRIALERLERDGTVEKTATYSGKAGRPSMKFRLVHHRKG